MRVVLLTSSYAPAVGGVEEFTSRLARHLVRAGHDVQVWTSRATSSGAGTAEVVDGIDVRRFDFPMPRAAADAMLQLPTHAGRSLRALRTAHRRFQPDVINVHCYSANGVYGTAVSAMTGTPLVVSLHGETLMDDHDIYERSHSLRWGLKWGLRRAAGVTACSELTLHDAEVRFGLDTKKAQVVHNAVDLDEAPAVHVQVPFDRYVLGLGRMVHKKGFDLLLRAFAEVDAPDVGLVLAGSGPQQAELEQLAVDLGVDDRTCFTGVLGRPEVAWVMANAEIFVLPSRVEPFGIVALEAWRAGTPLIATRHGGPAEYVRDGTDGVLIDPEDTVASAAALGDLLSDGLRRRGVGAAGRARLPDFTWSRVTDSFCRIYVDAASG